MSKITVKTPKPRNPLVAPSLFRKAGKHELSERMQRQRGQSALQREMKALEPPTHRYSP